MLHEYHLEDCEHGRDYSRMACDGLLLCAYLIFATTAGSLIKQWRIGMTIVRSRHLTMKMNVLYVVEYSSHKTKLGGTS